MMEVNRDSRLYLYDPQLEQKPLAVRVLQSQLHRVECYDDIDVALHDMLDARDGCAMALVNVPVEASVLYRLLDEPCVLVMRNLDRDQTMAALFEQCRSHMSMGQTYTNSKVAILIPNHKLQREDFLLWL